MTFIVVFFSFTISASMILEFERGYSSPIETANQALWWAFFSIMNAKALMAQPVSPEGMLATVLLNKIGLLLFAYVNASVIAWIVTSKDRGISMDDDS